jgi:DNA replication and repair protein RecF
MEPGDMIVTGIRLRNFRNHTDSTLEFGEGINALLGDNGEGKTNILEAVSYLSLTKSFYAATDGTVLQIGKEAFDLEGRIRSASGLNNVVRVVYSRMPGEKLYEVNGSRPERLSSVIGRFPIVILSPENSAITFGGPVERRKFIDLVLSQVSPAYLEAVLEYRRVLKQRNRVLGDARARGTAVAALIEPWDVSLVRNGSVIVARRRAFVDEFATYVTRAYRELVEEGERPEIAYVSSCLPPDGTDREEIERYMSGRLEERRSEEMRRGLTLVGPHRDDLGLAINGIPVQHYASQGQHKTMLVALKVAEFHFLSERSGERPIFLLDDVFSELDSHRASRILALASGLGQTMITTTDERAFRDAVVWDGKNRRYSVERGTCRPV